MRGKVLSGRYELVEKLGAGGMGEVWRARDRDLGREIAVKLFSPPEDVADQERTELLGRFRREARAAAALDSPHIATIYDHGADGGVPYLVMELVEGRSLEQVLRDEGRVPVGQALDWAEQICRALRVAHDAGVVHRDIKPANVIVSADGTAVVLDFGIAKFQEAAESESKLTRTGHMPLGSVLYMAPERFRMEPGDGREDLYALGCVLYELLIGRPPFVGPAAGVMYNHLNDTPLRPSRARTELSARLDELVLALMAKSPDDRPAEAEEAGSRLAELREGAAPEPEEEEEAEPVPEPEPLSVRETEPGPVPEPADAPPPPPRPVPVLAMPPARSRTRTRTALAIGAALLVLGGTGVTLMAAKGEPEPDYTVVYARPEENGGAGDAAVEKIVRKGVKASELDGTVEVTAVNSTTLELEDEVGKLPHVVAVLGETDLSPGVEGDDLQEYGSGDGTLPVTLNACPGRAGYGDEEPAMDNAFPLRTSPTDTAAHLAAGLRRAPGVRSVLLVRDFSDSEFSERFAKSFSRSGRKVSTYESSDDISDESGSMVADKLKKAKPDTIVLPDAPYEGPFTAGELRKAGFRGRVVTPLAPNCSSKGDLSGPPESGAVRGVQHYRYRDLTPGRKAARRNDLDAARALSAAFQQQSGTPDSGVLRGLLGEDLKTIEVPGTTGTLAFDERGYLKSRPFRIDRFDGKRWREERKLTPP